MQGRKKKSLRRLEPAKGGGGSGGTVFRIATVKRDPFKQEYIDLCARTFDEALGAAGNNAPSLFEQVTARGRHALQRSEIIKAQSVTLSKQVDGALKKQQQQQQQQQPDGGGAEESDADGEQQRAPSGSASDDAEAVKAYFAVRAGAPVQLELEQVLEKFAEELDDAAPERQAKVNVGQKIRMQAPPSSEMLLRNPASLAALLGLSANAPTPAPNEVSLPPNHELLALIEPADGIPPASDDEDWDDSSADTAEPAASSGPRDGAAVQMIEDAPSPASSGLVVADRPEQQPNSADNGSSEAPAGERAYSAPSLPSVSLALPTQASAGAAPPEAAEEAPPPPKPKGRKRKSEPKYGRILVDTQLPMPDMGPTPKARKPYTPPDAASSIGTLAQAWYQRPPPKAHSRPVLELSDDLNAVLPRNMADKKQMDKLFTHFLTRPEQHIGEFLRDKNANLPSPDILPFKTEAEASKSYEMDESNPLDIVDSVHDDDQEMGTADAQGLALARIDESPAEGGVEIKIEDECTPQRQPVAGAAEIKEEAPRLKSRPFGSAREFLRIKREEKQASRRQARRYSIRELSTFLAQHMQTVTERGDASLNLHTVRLKNPEVRLPSAICTVE